MSITRSTAFGNLTIPVVGDDPYAEFTTETIDTIAQGAVAAGSALVDGNIPVADGAAKKIKDSGVALANLTQAASTLTSGKVIKGSGSKGIEVGTNDEANLVTASAVLATDEIVLGAGADRTVKKSGLTTDTTITDSDTKVPTSGAVVDYIGARLTAWTAYTPTGSWTSGCSYAGQWRLSGIDTLQVKIRISATAGVTAAALTVDLPSGKTIDTAKFANSAGQIVVGHGFGFLGGAVNNPLTIFYNSTSSVKVFYHAAIGGADISMGPVTQAAPKTVQNNDYLDFIFEVPIS